MSSYKITKISDDFYLIALAPPLSGFSEFIGIWLYLGVPAFIVDVGPSTTITDLLDAFDKLNVRRLDYILLTHIHLDHAGGIGQFTARFPDTPIVCHQAAISHLLDPSRLWEGTKKVLGSMAEAYGPIQPVSGNPLLNAEQFTSDAITPIMTPGHAPHHVSFKTDKYLFAGETGGVFHSFSQDRFYLRPATPPRFFFEIALNSIDLLIESKPSIICYSHYGLKDNAVEMLKIHRRQLFFWKKIIRAVFENPGVEEPIEACTRKLLKVDALTAGFHDLPSAVQEREKYFLQNSIKGFISDIERGQEIR